MIASDTGCSHDRSHIVDSHFHGDGYSTPVSRGVFCDLCRMQRWLDVEAALALSQADVGIIGHDVAEEIARAARLERIDLGQLRRGIQATGHSLVSLLSALKESCGGPAGEFVHHGATTQDIQDTAQALEMREVMTEIDVDLEAIVAMLASLARGHRDTLMVGRTHAQPALPMTFGLKVSGWIDELLRDAERLDAIRPRVLVAELFGGVGTMAGFGERGPQLLERFCDRLGLGRPRVAWHVARDRVAEYLVTLAMLTATLARIADEIRTLSRPELGELEEGWVHGRVGSSTMPHKRNPEDAEQIVVMARLSRANAALGLEGMIQEHERDSRGLRLEWAAVADASHYTLASLLLLRRLVSGLKVHGDRMAEHAVAASEDICSEALMLALGKCVGKQTAHGLVYEISQDAQDRCLSLREAILSRAETAAHLSPEEVAAIFDPARHLGSAGALVDQTVDAAGHWLANRVAGRATGETTRPDHAGAEPMPAKTTGARSAAGAAVRA